MDVDDFLIVYKIDCMDIFTVYLKDLITNTKVTEKIFEFQVLFGYNVIIDSEHMYISGGNNSFTIFQNFFCRIYIGSFPMIKTETLARMLIGRYNHSMVSIGNNNLVMMGGFNKNELSICEKYDYSKNKWILIPDMLIANSNINACCTENRFIFIFSNKDNNFIQKMDLNSLNEWKRLDFPMYSSFVRKISISHEISENQILIIFGDSTLFTFYKYKYKSHRLIRSNSKIILNNHNALTVLKAKSKT